jgi:vacuolar-type H+-ATPase subunit F/Vma7
MRLALIADELTALAWRLIGARVLMPEASSVRECWQLALRDAEFIVITAQYAAAIPAAELDEALLGEMPLVLVIADLRGEHEPSELAHEVRHALGVSS